MFRTFNFMKHVSILTPLGHTSISNIENAYQIFSHVNAILKNINSALLFDIQLVGLSSAQDFPQRRFTATPHLAIGDIPATNLIIIPAMIGDPEQYIALNQEFIPWIQQQHRQGAEVASFCVGAFFLAATGLLNGRNCTTHWHSAADFKRMFPDALLVDDKIMTEDRGIYTSGGAFSYLNLIVYLIEKFVGREIAILIAKTYMIDIDRKSQSPFIIFQGQKAHGDQLIKQAQTYIEENYGAKITTDQLGAMLAISRRSLERRFRQATGNTINEYVRRVKIEAAKKEFESSRKHVNEVMYEVGYSDIKGFKGLFKKVTGLSPTEYRNKYNQRLARSVL